ncbi:YhcN/YlaJ family sporulation lipoprotein [Alkalihalobacillus sp. 1P02AB]|uniref:YhcN/YlaJ family sporulation lipoprotein n=1 Tax=Alkalihalobacillus sp. 1P02AB TaxID=3132260 RepID=UPI0039A7596D
MRATILMMSILLLIVLTGCVLEQQRPLGAKSDPDLTFSGLGTNEMRSHEGPITDMLVPDDTVLGLTKDKVPYQTGSLGYKRNIGITEKGTNWNGLMNNRPGLIKKLYAPDQSYLLERKPGTGIQQMGLDSTEHLKSSILSLETVEDVHIIETAEQMLIGIESSEANNDKLIRSIREATEADSMDKEVLITSKRSIINRMEAFENGEQAGWPFRSFKGMVAEMQELFR